MEEKLFILKIYNKNDCIEKCIFSERNFDLFKQNLQNFLNISIEKINNYFDIFEYNNNENSYNLINNNEKYLNLLKKSEIFLNIVIKPKNEKNINDVDDENCFKSKYY